MEKLSKHNLTISIDDVNPKKDWRIFGNKAEKWLTELNKSYGVRYNLFIPSNHYGEAPISEHKNWVNELIDSGMFELSAHGHFHKTSNYDTMGEMEFVDVSEPQSVERVKMMMGEWDSVGYKPKGWRNPGWICQPYCVPHLSKEFEWAALHYQHNNDLQWDLKMIFGDDSIASTNVQIHDGNFMFQSHIFGSWNTNNWDSKNLEQFKLSLDFLFTNYEINPVTISEL